MYPWDKEQRERQARLELEHDLAQRAVEPTQRSILEALEKTRNAIEHATQCRNGCPPCTEKRGQWQDAIRHLQSIANHLEIACYTSGIRKLPQEADCFPG